MFVPARRLRHRQVFRPAVAPALSCAARCRECPAPARRPGRSRSGTSGVGVAASGRKAGAAVVSGTNARPRSPTRAQCAIWSLLAAPTRASNELQPPAPAPSGAATTTVTRADLSQGSEPSFPPACRRRCLGHGLVDVGEQPVWKSKFYGAFVLNHRVVLHAIDATPLDGVAMTVPRRSTEPRAAASSPRNDLVKNPAGCTQHLSR